jgi:hypothetical protein
MSTLRTSHISEDDVHFISYESEEEYKVWPRKSFT